MALHALTDPIAVRRAINQFDALGRTAFLALYGFGRAREYMLRTQAGDLYDSKAIVGAAFGFQHPDRGPLRPSDFAGGEATVERKLRELGFEVVRIGDTWSREEVEYTVADYLDMLVLESQNHPFNKSEHNARLRIHLPRRSKASIEMKHQNISAILEEFGLPYVHGYKPRGNVQDLLRDVIGEALRNQEGRIGRALDALQDLRSAGEPQYAAALVDKPRLEVLPDPTPRARLPQKLDYAARDAGNRDLGRAGEAWALGFERYRLVKAARGDLAQRVDWSADRLGDGLGYDIASFNADETPRFIEVKTTNCGARCSFVVSVNELAFSREAGPAFFLYRVFGFSRHPQVFFIQGDLSDTLALTPLNYRAHLKAI